MYKIALTGASGLVGSRIVELLSKDFEFIPLSQKQLDITNKDQVWQNLKDLDFDFFLHLAAYTNVDQAEKEKEIVYQTNVNGTKNIFEVVNQKQKKMIYISTDYVFDGKNPPYDETSLPQPLGYYAQTKFEGEKIIGKEGMNVRIAYPYRKQYELKKDFVRTVKFLLEQNKTFTMINDSTMTPTFIDDIAYGLKYLFNNYSPEIFHLVGADSFSPFECGKLIAKNFGLDEQLIQPIAFAEYFKNKAPRPQYATIKSTKNTFYKMKTLMGGLKMLRE